ncbi:hypothetical protein HK100_009954 [Physocladia obscura]|uniref:W2 domain-containing protein n=1 Tax=Physocladia obscura TaxID=109957 RepID=A0AAD5XI29_9FUNG|nr:hypothetical protein HK100_009954 [Physocladia obscura]
MIIVDPEAANTLLSDNNNDIDNDSDILGPTNEEKYSTDLNELKLCASAGLRRVQPYPFSYSCQIRNWLQQSTITSPTVATPTPTPTTSSPMPLNTLLLSTSAAFVNSAHELLVRRCVAKPQIQTSAAPPQTSISANHLTLSPTISGATAETTIISAFSGDAKAPFNISQLSVCSLCSTPPATNDISISHHSTASLYSCFHLPDDSKKLKELLETSRLANRKLEAQIKTLTRHKDAVRTSLSQAQRTLTDEREAWSLKEQAASQKFARLELEYEQDVTAEQAENAKLRSQITELEDKIEKLEWRVSDCICSKSTKPKPSGAMLKKASSSITRSTAVSAPRMPVLSILPRSSVSVAFSESPSPTLIEPEEGYGSEESSELSETNSSSVFSHEAPQDDVIVEFSNEDDEISPLSGVIPQADFFSRATALLEQQFNNNVTWTIVQMDLDEIVNQYNGNNIEESITIDDNDCINAIMESIVRVLEKRGSKGGPATCKIIVEQVCNIKFIKYHPKDLQILYTLQHVICESQSNLRNIRPHLFLPILKCFYNSELVDVVAILEWHGSLRESVNTQTLNNSDPAAVVYNNCLPFAQWLEKYQVANMSEEQERNLADSSSEDDNDNEENSSSSSQTEESEEEWDDDSDFLDDNVIRIGVKPEIKAVRFCDE